MTSTFAQQHATLAAFFQRLALGADSEACTTTTLYTAMKSLLDNSTVGTKSATRDFVGALGHNLAQQLNYDTEIEHFPEYKSLSIDAWDGRHSYGGALLSLDFSKSDPHGVRVFYGVLENDGLYRGPLFDVDIRNKTVSQGVQLILDTVKQNNCGIFPRLFDDIQKLAARPVQPFMPA